MSKAVNSDCYFFKDPQSHQLTTQGHWTLVAGIATGIIAALAGALALYAAMHTFPQPVNFLNTLNHIGLEGSIGLLAGGTLLCIAGVITLIKWNQKPGETLLDPTSQTPEPITQEPKQLGPPSPPPPPPKAVHKPIPYVLVPNRYEPVTQTWDEVISAIPVESARQQLTAQSASTFSPLGILANAEEEALYDALLNNDGRALSLIQKGVRCDRVTKCGDTALHKAVWWHQEALLPLLLATKPNVNVRDIKGQTPLHFAAGNSNDHPQMVEALLQAGARLDIKDKNGLIPYDLTISRNTNSIAHRNNKIQKLLTPPLIVAAQEGKVDEIVRLVQNGHDVNVRDGEGKTPLHRAIIHGREGAFVKLCELGADTKIVDKKELSALHVAAMYGRVTLMERLLKDIPLTSQDQEGNTPLHMAIEWGRTAAALFLIDKGAPVDLANKVGNTPLHIASHMNQIASAWFLLNKGASKEVLNAHKETPKKLAHSKAMQSCLSNFSAPHLIHEMIEKGQDELVKMLIDRVDCTYVYHGQTPLQVAEKVENEAIAALLRSKVAQPPAVN